MNTKLYECRSCRTVATKKKRRCEACGNTGDDGSQSVFRRIRADEIDL